MINKTIFAQNLELGTKNVRENTRRYCDNYIPLTERFNEDKADKRYNILDKKGEANGQQTNTTDVKSGIQERNSVLSKVRAEHGRRVGVQRQIISEDNDAPFNLREACKSGEGIVHYLLRCCGRFTANDEMLYHRQEGYPPFHCFGPILPRMDYDLEKNGKFDLNHYRDRKKKRNGTQPSY